MGRQAGWDPPPVIAARKLHFFFPTYKMQGTNTAGNQLDKTISQRLPACGTDPECTGVCSATMAWNLMLIWGNNQTSTLAWALRLRLRLTKLFVNKM